MARARGLTTTGGCVRIQHLAIRSLPDGEFVFETLGSRLQSVFDNLQKRGKLTEAEVDVAMREVRLALLEADVNFTVGKAFVGRLRERAIVP